ncbi:hypothetical protein [Phocaeicola abscessus]|uniref:hypothetical protein n=1 Tax=Phocaeicola abscessus TaxID=555313 RepID=UPI001FEE87C2|nr:hypothetical protein [Phocaeicola abscessus]
MKSPIRQFREGAQQDGFNYTFKIEMIDKIVQAENKAEDIDKLITLMQTWLALEWYGMREETKKGIMSKEDKKTLQDNEYNKYTKWIEEKDNGQK